MCKVKITLVLTIFLTFHAHSKPVDPETKKSYIEDIFIWKISDELKLTVSEEKKFTEISKSLNKKKSELNKKINEAVMNLSSNSSEEALAVYKKLLQEYNQLNINEFDLMKKLLGTKKFISYVKIKYELTNKIKSAILSDKNNEDSVNKPTAPLPPPKVIIEK